MGMCVCVHNVFHTNVAMTVCMCMHVCTHWRALFPSTNERIHVQMFPASSTSSSSAEYYARMVFSIFTRYIRVVRCVQEEYSLEPAGSHGVWGLDDFNHMVYILGASQLRNHKFIRPRSALNADVLDGYADTYIFLDQVRHVVRYGSRVYQISIQFSFFSSCVDIDV